MPSGPSDPSSMRKQRLRAPAVEPRPGGDTSRTITAAGARQHSLQQGRRSAPVSGSSNQQVASPKHARAAQRSAALLQLCWPTRRRSPATQPRLMLLLPLTDLSA